MPILTIGKGPFKDTYKSDVKFNKKENSIHVTNIGGPLKHLDNKWNFKKHNRRDSRFILMLILKLKNKFLNIVNELNLFNTDLDKIVDAFQKRANKSYLLSLKSKFKDFLTVSFWI